MKHVFISYSSKDRAKTKKLAAILEANGLKVWWDKNLKPGKAFDTSISKALDNAYCIVVLWSSNSIQSNWVLEEAYEGLERDILVPTMIANTKIPFGYRRIQYVDLSKWRGAATSPVVQKLIASVFALAPTPKKSSSTTKPKTNKPKAASAKLKKARTFSGALDGKTIVFTGALSESRKAHSEKVRVVGANFVDNVSSKTDYLVVGKNPGAVKLKAAQKHGTKKLSEKRWLNLLNDTYQRTFKNKQVAFTGKLSMTRKELEKSLKSIGAKMSEKVTSKTNYLIVGQKPGKVKLAAAEKYSIQIIQEQLWEEILHTF
ncbi:MAG: TIR domain-containing protein [Bacteroidota bacterium]